MFDLDAIEARANAATPGPWRADESFSIDGTAVFVCRTVPGVADYWQGDRDSEFIAHAREDIPAMAAEIRRLRADVAQLAAVALDAERERLDRIAE